MTPGSGKHMGLFAPRLAGCYLWCVACGAFLAGVSAAECADQPAPPPAVAEAPVQPNVTPFPYDPGSHFEALLGLYLHGVGDAERDTADLNASFLTPRLDVGLPGYWAYLLPRLRVGGAANLFGRTSFAYVDAMPTLPVTPWLYLAPFVGGAIHDGSLTPTPTMSGLGCRELFHAGVSAGVPITEHWNVTGTFEHLSNGKSLFGIDCGTNQAPHGSNQGLNNYGLSIGYAF